MAEGESRALLLLGSLPQSTAVAVVEAEGRFAFVASCDEERTASRNAVECSRKVRHDIVVEVDFEKDTAQARAGCGTVALPGCLDSIRQKPSCLL